VELAVVVVVLGLLFALAMPRVRVDNTVVDTAARTITLSLMTAQRDAVARAHTVLVTFTVANHTARAVWDANNNGVADAGEKTRPFPLPDGARFGRPASVPPLDGDASTPGTDVVVLLQRNGAADRVHTLYLSTERALNGGPHADARALRITRATGRPMWYAWTGTEWRPGL
jgi:Tfp pilus assembly protein FimT